MKIYVQDHGVYGCIVVLAENKEQARKFMEGEYNYDKNEPVEEMELEPGVIHVNLGDS